jgi:hypothetical protein
MEKLIKKVALGTFGFFSFFFTFVGTHRGRPLASRTRDDGRGPWPVLIRP